MPPGSSSHQHGAPQSGKTQNAQSSRKPDEAHVKADGASAPQATAAAVAAAAAAAAGRQRVTFRQRLEKAAAEYEEMQGRVESVLADNQRLLAKLAVLEKEKEEARGTLREQQQTLEQKQKALEALEGEKQRAVNEKQAVLAEKQRLEHVARDLEGRLHGRSALPNVQDASRIPFNPADPVDLAAADRREVDGSLADKSRNAADTARTAGDRKPGRSSSSSRSSSSHSSSQGRRKSKAKSHSGSGSRSRSRSSGKSKSASTPRRRHRRRRRTKQGGSSKASVAPLAAQPPNMPPMIPPAHLQAPQGSVGMPMHQPPPPQGPMPPPQGQPPDWWRSAPPSGWVGPGFGGGR